MEVKSIKTDSNKKIQLTSLFETSGIGNMTMGTVVIPPGARVPEEGVSQHTGDEYSIIVKGTITAESGSEIYHVSSNQATFIPAGETHIAYNEGNEDCEIVWVMVEE